MYLQFAKSYAILTSIVFDKGLFNALLMLAHSLQHIYRSVLSRVFKYTIAALSIFLRLFFASIKIFLIVKFCKILKIVHISLSNANKLYEKI